MAESSPNQSPTASPPVMPPERKQRKKHHGWLWLIILLLLIAIVVLYWLRRPKHKPAAYPPVAISVTNVQVGPMPVTVTALGTVVPVYTAAISPRVDGQIIKVNYKEGQLVKTNDLLVEIDPGPFEATLTQAQGQLARDQALLEIARIDLKRYQEAYKRKAIPEQQLADQQATVRQAEGTVKLDQGAVENAKVQLAYCYVRAPFSGRVGLRLVDPGNVVHAANTNAMLVIAEVQPITVIFNVAEDYVPEIQRQALAGHRMPVEAYDRSFSKKLATGSYLTMDNLIDTATGTIRIRALFTNEDLTLFPNQFVNARLVIEVLTNQLLVPTFAIQRNPQGSFVYVVTNQVATEIITTNRNSINVTVTNEIVAMRNIKVDIMDTNTASVEGLKANEIIAVDNFNKLGDGVKVTSKPQSSRITNAPSTSRTNQNQ